MVILSDITFVLNSFLAHAGLCSFVWGRAHARLALSAFHPAILALTGSGTPVFVWYKKGEEEVPIVAIHVLYGDEAVPAGFVKVAKDLKKGGGGDAKTYLCIKRQTAGDEALPIVGIRILNSDSAGVLLWTCLWFFVAILLHALTLHRLGLSVFVLAQKRAGNASTAQSTATTYAFLCSVSIPRVRFCCTAVLSAMFTPAHVVQLRRRQRRKARAGA